MSTPRSPTTGSVTRTAIGGTRGRSRSCTSGSFAGRGWSGSEDAAEDGLQTEGEQLAGAVGSRDVRQDRRTEAEEEAGRRPEQERGLCAELEYRLGDPGEIVDLDADLELRQEAGVPPQLD